MIRRYRPDDREAVLDVWSRASALAHPFLGRAFLDRERREIAERYLPAAETWVRELGGRVVGYVALLEDEIGALFVDPGHQRRGIGRELLVLARRLRGDLEVEVFEDNPIGRSFYAREGFAFVHRAIHEPTGRTLLRLRLPAERFAGPGTYALILRSTLSTTIEIGRRGPLAVVPGWYVYVGSARGPGGARARIGRHVRERKPLRWHVDHLRRVTTPVCAWVRRSGLVLEHRWARAFAGVPAATPVPDFGSSDCACPTHLFHLAAMPDAERFRRAVGGRIAVWSCLGEGDP